MGELIQFPSGEILQPQEPDLPEEIAEYIYFTKEVLTRLNVPITSRFREHITLVTRFLTTPSGFKALSQEFTPRSTAIPFLRTLREQRRQRQTHINLLTNTFFQVAGAMGYQDKVVDFSNKSIVKEDGTFLVYGVGFQVRNEPSRLVLQVPTVPGGQRQAQMRWE